MTNATDAYVIRWKPGDIIRQRATGKPMMVTLVVDKVATFIVDLNTQGPAYPMVILIRDNDQWATDSEMECEEVKVKDNIDLKFKYSPIYL